MYKVTCNLNQAEMLLRDTNASSSSIMDSSENGVQYSGRPSHQENHGVEVIEQFEPGVYVTLMQNPDGTKEFKRVRFSKRRFAEQQAELWWKENQDRVFKKYNYRVPSSPATADQKAAP